MSLTILGIMIACQRPQASSAVAPLHSDVRDTVPLVAPESIPEAVLDSLGEIPNPNNPRAPWARRVVAITFRDGTSQLERTRALALISGRVIGGRKSYIGEGVYYVAIPGTTLGGLLRAIDVMKQLGQIETAGPLILGNYITIH